MDYNLYINKDGTYTSPRNGKIYKSRKSFIAHMNFKGSPTVGWNAANITKFKCQYCGKLLSKSNLKRHEKTCKLNPDNLKLCPVCGKPIMKGGTTCSYACSNTYFRSGINSPKYKPDSYRTICFYYNKKQCVICGEDKIVEVHHYDNDHNNNDKNNLVPLCPTHHKYVHSRYKYLVQHKIDEYVQNRSKQQ